MAKKDKLRIGLTLQQLGIRLQLAGHCEKEDFRDERDLVETLKGLVEELDPYDDDEG